MNRRSFLAFTGAVIAGFNGLSISDILRAESLAISSPPTGQFFSIAEDAAKLILDIFTTYELDDVPGACLRIGIDGNEADGFNAQMGFDNQIDETEDISLAIRGIPVVVRRECKPALSGVNIILGEQGGKKGFLFDGPLFQNRARV